jgi:hypothetical protein
MEFGLLGPLVVRCGETVLPVPRGKQRALLAVLLLNRNRVVPVDEVAEIFWGAGPPPSAPVTIRNYVSRLRQALGEAGRERISFRVHGYLISVGVVNRWPTSTPTRWHCGNSRGWPSCTCRRWKLASRPACGWAATPRC